MHHSQLEYLIAVQKLQGEEMGAQGNKLAEEMDVSTGYILKLTKAAESGGTKRICPPRESAFGIYHRSGHSGNAGIPACSSSDGAAARVGRRTKTGNRKRRVAERLCRQKYDAGSIGTGKQARFCGNLNFFVPKFAYANAGRRKRSVIKVRKDRKNI